MPSQLANGSTSVTHKVFQISEIVELILSFLDSSSTAHSARVCRRWSDIALNLLWRDLPDLYPLFEVLCPLVDQGIGFATGKDTYGFTRKLGASDWQQFSRYARRVKSLTFDTDGPKQLSFRIFDEVARSRPTLHLLPRLRKLAWWADNSDRMRCSLMFMHEHITQFSASLYTDEDYPLPIFLKEVVLRMPGLIHLDLRFHFRVREVEDDIVSLLGDLPKLKQVIFPLYTLTSRIMETLSRLPHVGVIQFEFNESQGQGDVTDVLYFAPQLTADAFPSLWDLSLSAKLEDVTAFLGSAFGPTHLTSLYVHILTPTELDEITRFLNTLADNCQLLSHLYLDYMKSPDIPENEIPANTERLTWNTLRPLLTLPNVTVFEMRWDQPIQITQAEVEDIAIKWPSLEVLLLNCEPLDPTEESTLTLQALIPFARHCPKLHELGLYVSAAQTTYADSITLPPSVKPFKCLNRLSMGLSSISDAGPVALFLSRLCPLDCALASGVTWPEGFGMEETSNNRVMLDALQAKAAVWWEKWAEAARVLPLLTRLRMQERDARAELEREVEDLRTRCRLLAERKEVQMRPDDSCVAL